MTPYEDLGFAKVDHDRSRRQGTAEVIFGQGKTPDQVAAIAKAILDREPNVLCTRANADMHERLLAVAQDATYDPNSRILKVVRQPRRVPKTVGILCAGTSDLPVAEEAAQCAEFYGLSVARHYDVGVAGLHRLLAQLPHLEELDAAIVVAGMEGALPSVVAGLLACPIIAVPTSVGYGASLQGITALLAMLSSCAAGVVVVNIDNGFGAAAAAFRLLGAKKRELSDASKGR